MVTDIRIYNMHGPTVYAVGAKRDIRWLLGMLEWLNRPASNAGLYRIVITVDGFTFEAVPFGR